MIGGSCLCGDITVSVSAPLSRVVACHCGQCRKQSGHVWAIGSAPREKVAISGDLNWYAASDAGKRGFCPRCGSLMFWRGHDEPTIEVALGALDTPTGLRLEGHIFVVDKGDYYEIADDLPQFERDVE